MFIVLLMLFITCFLTPAFLLPASRVILSPLTDFLSQRPSGSLPQVSPFVFLSICICVSLKRREAETDIPEGSSTLTAPGRATLLQADSEDG